MAATRGTQVGGGRHAFVPATWNGRGRIPAGWSDPSPLASNPLSVGLICFDNWWKGAETHVPEIGNDGTLRTAYTHRQPLAFEPGMYSSDETLATISLAREQEIADQWIQDAAAGGITYLARLWYPLVSQQDTVANPGEPGHEHLMRMHQRYMASAYKSQLQWCWIAQSGWMYDMPHLVQRIGYMIAEVDSQYLRAFPSRPVMYLFQAGGYAWDATTVAVVRSLFGAAGLGNPYLISCGMSLGDCVTAKLDGRSAYGPLDVALSGGQNSWSAMAAADVSATQFVHGTVNAVPHLSGGTDQRPISSAGYADPPTASQWIAHVKGAKTFIDANSANCPQNLCLIYSADELAERGGIMATAQNDVHGTGRGYYLDGIAHAIGLTPRATVVDSFGPTNQTHVTLTTWTLQTGVAGAYQSERIRSATAAEYVEATRTTAASGVFNVYGAKGPDCGIANVQLDGGAATPVDLYAAVAAENQLIMSYTGLSAASHVVRVTVTGTKNASSSAAFVAVDQFKALVVPP